MLEAFKRPNFRHSTLINLAISVAIILMAAVLYFLLRPTIVRIAVDKNSGVRHDIITEAATQLQKTHASLQFKVIDTSSYAESAAAIDEDKADAAVVQSLQMPNQGQTIAILQRNPVIFISSEDKHISNIANLIHKRLGIIENAEFNQQLLEKILSQNSLSLNNVTLVPVSADNIADALANNHIDAMMTSMPIQGSFLQNVLHKIVKTKNRKPVIFGVDDSEALVQRYPLLENYEIKKGVFGSHPQQPNEDITTLAHSERLVVNTNMDNNTASDLTRLIFSLKPSIAHRYPTANAIELLDPETAVKLDLHPGARAWYSGEQKSFIERYSDVFYIGMSVAGGLISLIGGLITYLFKQRRDQTSVFVNKAESLLFEIRQVDSFDELQNILLNSDTLFTDAIEKFGDGQISAEQFAWVSAVTQHINVAAQQRSADLRHTDLKSPS